MNINNQDHPIASRLATAQDGVTRSAEAINTWCQERGYESVFDLARSTVDEVESLALFLSTQMEATRDAIEGASHLLQAVQQDEGNEE
jgi:hypothetical protein